MAPDDPWPRFRPRALLRRLAEHDVDFVVIGGFAAIAHGGARLTNDLDISCATTADNLDRLGAALVDLGARLRGVPEDVPFVPDARTWRNIRVLTLETSEGFIDVLAEPAGAPAYDTLRERAERVELDGVEVRVAGLGDLQAMKRAAGRPKDLLDLEELDVIARLRERDASP